MRGLSLLVVLGAASAAHAAPPDAMVLDDVHPDFGTGHWSAFAQVTSETTKAASSASAATGEVVAGAELHRETAMCTVLALGGEGRLRGDRDGVHVGGEQWLSGCFGVAHFFALEMTHHLELDLRPTFADRRDLWRRPFTRETGSFGTTMIDADLSDGGIHLTAIHTTFSPAYVMQSSDGRARSVMLLDASATVAQLSGPRGGDTPWQIALLDFSGATVDDGGVTAETFQLAFLHGRNLPLGRRVLLDGSLGIQAGSLTRDDPQHPMVLVDTTKAGAELALHGELAAGWTGGIGGVRSEYPTFDLEIAREDRVSAWVTAHRGDTRITLRSFAARTEVTGADGVAQHGVTGGGQAQLDRDLRHVHLAASTEVARSYYAQVDASVDPTPRPELGARVLLTLSARAHSR